MKTLSFKEILKPERPRYRAWGFGKMQYPDDFSDVVLRPNGEVRVWIDIKENSGLSHNIEEVEIMLSTKEADMKGREIFDLDIFKYRKGDNYYLDYVHFEGAEGFFPFHAKKIIPALIEVVGNFYENPDLIAPLEESLSKRKHEKCCPE